VRNNSEYLIKQIMIHVTANFIAILKAPCKFRKQKRAYRRENLSYTFVCFDYYDYSRFNLSYDNLKSLLQKITLLLTNKTKL
jgi:hypothetical protein